MMDLSLLKRIRDMDLDSLDEKALEQELEKRLTFAEQRTAQRFSIKNRGSTATSHIREDTGETFDGRGRDLSHPISPGLHVTDAVFDYCRVCAEFEPQKALRLANRSNVFVSSDGSCQIMVRLPDIMRAKEQRGCRSCMALIVGISNLYNTSGLDMSRIDHSVDYDDDDIEATITFKKDNVLRMYLSRRSTGNAVESLGLSFFALPMIEFYSQPGQTRMFPTIGSDMTKLYPEYPDKNIPGGQANDVGLATYASKSSYVAMKRWIDECMEYHEVCSSAYAQLGKCLPSRVIDVGVYDKDPIKLYRSGGKKDHYIALSHCWGPKDDKNILRCTQATYSKYQKEVPWDKLPKTFKDAVTITRLFGIRYLWIDSLCIIQDSPDDWRWECQLMSSIYQSAFLVISATASYDSTGGCYHESLRLVEWEHENAAGEPACLYIRQSHDHSAFGERGARAVVRTGEPYKSEYPALPSPVFGRAWCYQERLLGTRIIHFADTELVFECLTGVNCECGALNNWQQDDLFFSRRFLANPSRNWSTTPQLISQTWKNMVESYSAKDITYQADKLPALAGLAQLFQLGMGAYYAGIFEKDLFSCILWSSSNPNKKRRPDTYVAPSWSWASVVGKIRFGDDASGFFGFRDGEYCARIPYVECVLENKDDCYGRVKSGLLKINGFMSSGLLVAPESDQSQYFLQYGEEYIYKSSPLRYHHHYEADCYEESYQLAKRLETVGCLWFCSSGPVPQATKIQFLYGFVVAKVKGSKSWRRVGLVKTTEISHLPLESDPRPRTLERQEIAII